MAGRHGHCEMVLVPWEEARPIRKSGPADEAKQLAGLITRPHVLVEGVSRAAEVSVAGRKSCQ